MQPKGGFIHSEAERVIPAVKLHAADLKLIRLIRSIGSGEIESLKIKNGLAVHYKTAWKKGKL